MSESRSQTTDLFIQISALIFLGGAIAVLVMTYRPGNSQRPLNTSLIKSGPAPTIILATVPRNPAAATLVHGKPPSLHASTVGIMRMQLNRSMTRELPIFFVSVGQQLHAVSLSSFLTQSQWDASHQFEWRRSGSTDFVATSKPIVLGSITEDVPPNLQLKPDLSSDLVAWKIVKADKPALLLAERLVTPETPVWILSLPITSPPTWLQGQVLEASEKAVYVKPLERFESEKLIGTIIVNQQGEIVSTCQGGEFALTGASSVGILRRLRESSTFP